MKRFILAALVAAFALAGCASQQASSLQGKIAAACPVVQVAVADVQALGASLPADVQAKIATQAPVIAAVCAGNATIDTSSLAAVVQTGLPALIADVNATTLSAADKAKVVTALALAQIALTAVVQAQPQPTASVAPAPQ
ncbi:MULTISPECIES: hypothetical protein [unclassified Achromobacter]|uniref:hypothetical protein n=1 Tax=unclassified Achromobacter TaxID=2626865 RepID=UPI000B51C5A3|nr:MULTISPECIES: hypothetical protein [unclassified Achromobacter]OWT69194.1 hypothetical protein CEY05_28625 [Achromobacter sp. HZ34]OWT70599.1 hypothetical protein CEY04_27455 [Achromobacter sp. HZ28]